MTARKIIIDCDPGVDDAIGLLLAFAARDALDILAVTTVAGNVPLVKTAMNARLVRTLAKREEAPVLAGCPRPLVREPVLAEEFHGESGLGNLRLPPAKGPLSDEHAVAFITRTLAVAPPRSVTLVAMGPLTNFAAAIILAPHILAAVAEIVLMGGARTEGGNITASAEYNIYADPHAAHVVLASGARVVVIGLDATHQVRSTAARIAAIAALATPAAAAVAALMNFAAGIEFVADKGLGAPLHDPCTIAYLLQPDLFTLAPCRIAVETAAPLTLGHTAIELRDPPLDAPLRWATHADADGIFALLTERLSRL